MTARRTIFALLSAGLLGFLPGVGCSENPVTGQRELSLISREQEIALGEDAAPQFEQEFGGVAPNPAVQEYIAAVGGRLARQSHRPDMPYTFALLNSDTANAFALPGGKIYMTRGLFTRLDNEAELAAVLGHEIGHVAAKHNIQALQRQMGVQLLAQLAGMAAGEDKAAATEAGAKVAGSMLTLRYSRDAEYEADRLGVEYLGRTEYNPWGMVSLLELLQSLGGGESSIFAQMFATHPLNSERVEQARGLVQQEYPGVQDRQQNMYPERFQEVRARLTGAPPPRRPEEPPAYYPPRGRPPEPQRRPEPTPRDRERRYYYGPR